MTPAAQQIDVINPSNGELIATVHRDGHEWTLKFKSGKPAAPLKKVRPFRGHGTTIYFRPDDAIFRTAEEFDRAVALYGWSGKGSKGTC